MNQFGEKLIPKDRTATVTALEELFYFIAFVIARRDITTNIVVATSHITAIVQRCYTIHTQQNTLRN